MSDISFAIHILRKNSLAFKTSFSLLFVITSTPSKLQDITSTEKSLRSFILSLFKKWSHQVINSLLLPVP